MTHRFTLALLLGCFLFAACPQYIYAQSPIYKPFEVDSVATPIGGQAMLETFLAVNLQKPFMAKVANVTGKVFVTAVVEPNGRVSDVQLMRSLRPDCDQEALRIIRLFNAWKPAMKSGQPVRQLITYPVTFQANEPVTYANGQRIEYFDKDRKPTIDPQNATYQQTTSLDSLTGLPSGDLVSYSMRANGKLRELVRLPLKRLADSPNRKGEATTFTVGYKQADGTWYNSTYTVDEADKIVRRRTQGDEVRYDSTGMVYYAKSGDDNPKIMEWFSNGLLYRVETLDKTISRQSGIDPYRLMAAWDSTGRQLIVDGNGAFTQYARVRSRADTSQRVQFVETGKYADGLKDGRWTGRYSDGSYTYDESFDKGKPLGGSATINKTKKLTYGITEQNPDFKGGQQGMYRFLGQTIKYPSLAAKAGVQGKVFISFTVCTDGSLCDYEVVKGVEPSIDEEALRVVRAMDGQWNPGFQRGEPVRVKYNLPISFQFQ